MISADLKVNVNQELNKMTGGCKLKYVSIQCIFSLILVGIPYIQLDVVC